VQPGTLFPRVLKRQVRSFEEDSAAKLEISVFQFWQKFEFLGNLTYYNNS
jgi:hypothetical protein